MKIEHIAMYVNDLEAAREFFVKYLDAVSNDGYYNKTTGFRSYFLCFEEGARLEIMKKPQMDDFEKHWPEQVLFIWLLALEARRR